MLALECDTGLYTRSLRLVSVERMHGRQAAGGLEMQQNTSQGGVEELETVW